VWVEVVANPRQRLIKSVRLASQQKQARRSSRTKKEAWLPTLFHALTPSPPRHTPHKPAQEDKAMEVSNSVELTDPSAIIQVRSKLRLGAVECCEKRSSPTPPHTNPSMPSTGVSETARRMSTGTFVEGRVWVVDVLVSYGGGPPLSPSFRFVCRPPLMATKKCALIPCSV
jgi:hypothetical protein